jgi:hypothetical protein
MTNFLYRPIELWGAISTFGIISSIIYLLMFYHRKF